MPCKSNPRPLHSSLIDRTWHDLLLMTFSYWFFAPSCILFVTMISYAFKCQINKKGKLSGQKFNGGTSSALESHLEHVEPQSDDTGHVSTNSYRRRFRRFRKVGLQNPWHHSCRVCRSEHGLFLADVSHVFTVQTWEIYGNLWKLGDFP